MTEPLDPLDSDARTDLLDRLNPEALPGLAAFLAGYLHEDWQLEFASPAEAVFAFIGAADLDDVEELAADWEALVEAARSLELDEINRLLHERFRCAWQISSKREIEAVERELERALRE